MMTKMLWELMCGICYFLVSLFSCLFVIFLGIEAMIVYHTDFFNGGGFLMESFLFYQMGGGYWLFYMFLLLEGILVMTVIMFKSSQKILVLVEMLILIGFVTYLMINSHNMFISSMVLITVSVCSLYLVLGTSGSKMDVSCLFFFKFIPDMTVLLLLGVFGLFGIYYDLSMMNPVSSFVYQHLDLMGMVLVFYTLLGVFGFWMFWSMESSYFMSCYMHTCGLVFVGMYFFFMLSSYGCLGSYKIIYMCCGVSFMSILLFLLFFLCMGNIKSSLGFFSASSICYVFLFFVIGGPYVGLLGFFVSSVIKVGLFYLVEKVKDSSLEYSFSVMLCIVFALMCVTLHYYMFPYIYYLLKSGVGKGSLSFLLYSYSFLTSFMIYLIPSLEVFCLMLHLFSVMSSCSKGGDKFYLSSFKFNVVFIEMLYMLFNIFLILELCLTWKVGFHGYFVLLFLVMFLCLFSVWFFFMGAVSGFEYFISGCLVSGLSFLFGVTVMNSSGTTYYDYHSLFNNLFNQKMGSASIGVILILFILLVLMFFYVYYIYNNSYMSSAKVSLMYTYDLFGNSVVNPLTKGGSAMSTSSQSGKKGWDMLQFSKKLGFQFTSSPFSGYCYDQMFASDVSVESYFGGSLIGIKLLICDKIFSLDMSLVTSKVLGYKVQMSYTCILLTMYKSKYFMSLFSHWLMNIWMNDSEKDKAAAAEATIYMLNSTSDTSYKHIMDLMTNDFWSEFNSSSFMEKIKCGVYGIYSYSSWIVTFGWAGELIEGEPYFYYGSTYFSSKDYPDIYSDEIYTGDIALLWEMFSSSFLYKAYVAIPLGMDAGDLENLMYIISSSLGAKEDGSILMAEHPVLDDPFYLNLFLSSDVSEVGSFSLEKEKYISDLLAMAEGDVYLVDQHDKLKKDGKLFPWFLYDGCFSIVIPHLPTNSDYPMSMWDFKDSVKMGLFPFNFSMWTVSESVKENYIIGSSDFVTDLIESGEKVDTGKKMHPIYEWMRWIQWGGYPMSESVANKFKMKHDSLKWSSEFYLHDEDSQMPPSPY